LVSDCHPPQSAASVNARELKNDAFPAGSKLSGFNLFLFGRPPTAADDEDDEDEDDEDDEDDEAFFFFVFCFCVTFFFTTFFFFFFFADEAAEEAELETAENDLFLDNKAFEEEEEEELEEELDDCWLLAEPLPELVLIFLFFFEVLFFIVRL
jgi:hypothetical protein